MSTFLRQHPGYGYKPAFQSNSIGILLEAIKCGVKVVIIKEENKQLNEYTRK